MADVFVVTRDDSRAVDVSITLSPETVRRVYADGYLLGWVIEAKDGTFAAIPGGHSPSHTVIAATIRAAVISVIEANGLTVTPHPSERGLDG